MMDSVVEGQQKVGEILKERERAYDDLKRERDSLMEDHEDLLAESKQLRVMMESLENTVRETQASLDRMATEKTTLQDEVARVKTELEMLNNEIPEGDAPEVVATTDERRQDAPTTLPDPQATPLTPEEVTGMTDAEKMETMTLDIITEMEKKIMEFETEKAGWDAKLKEAEDSVLELRDELTREKGKGQARLDEDQGRLDEDQGRLAEGQARLAEADHYGTGRSRTESDSDCSIAIDMEDVEEAVIQPQAAKHHGAPAQNSNVDASQKEIARLFQLLAAEKENNAQLQMQMLNSQQENPEEEMTMGKAACQKLSGIIRDKDVEINALGQKVQTLVSVLDMQPTDGQQQGSKQAALIKSLLEEKDLFIKQIVSYQNEREQFTAMISQKHQECVNYYQELARVMGLYQQELQVKEQMQRESEEDKKNLERNETEIHREKEKTRILKERLDREGRLRAESELETKSIENEEMEDKEGQFQRLKSDLRNMGTELLKAKGETQSERKAKTSLEGESKTMQKQIDVLKTMVHASDAAAVETTPEDASQPPSTSNDNKHKKMIELMEMVEHYKKASETAAHEAETSTTKLTEAKASERELLRKVVELNTVVEKSTRDNDRFKSELMRLHEGQEHEMVAWQQREGDLEQRLEDALERANRLGSSLAHLETKSFGKEKSLSDQLLATTRERDEARSELAAMTNNMQQYARAVANLQMVLEQFQREKDSAVQMESQKHQQMIGQKQRVLDDATHELRHAKVKIVELEEAVDAASRLTEQIEKKEGAIGQLKKTITERDEALRTTVHALGELKMSMDSKVDKALMKSLFLGFLHTPKGHKKEVLPPLAAVLELSPDETKRAASAIDGGGVSGTLGGLASRIGGLGGYIGGSTLSTPAINESFSEMFVKFLQEESLRTPVVPLPAEAMAADQIRMAATRALSATPPSATRPPPRPIDPAAQVVPLTIPTFHFAQTTTSEGTTSTSLPHQSAAPGLSTYSLISPMDPLLPLFTNLPTPQN